MIWGCMSSKGVGNLYMIEGTVNADKYITILDEKLLPSLPLITSGDYSFQQDGAPCHTARKVKSWLAEKNIPLLPWIASSPDMSPIETLWGIMKTELKKRPVRNVSDLKEKLTEIWNSYTPEFCDSIVATMPRRIQDLLEKKGGVTKW